MVSNASHIRTYRVPPGNAARATRAVSSGIGSGFRACNDIGASSPRDFPVQRGVPDSRPQTPYRPPKPRLNSPPVSKSRESPSALTRFGGTNPVIGPRIGLTSPMWGQWHPSTRGVSLSQRGVLPMIPSIKLDDEPIGLLYVTIE